MSDETRSGKFTISGTPLWSLDAIYTGVIKSSDPVRFKVEGSVPAPGMDDMDWTEPCLERGSTFSVDGVISSDPIPIEGAYVKDEVLHFWGYATLGES